MRKVGDLNNETKFVLDYFKITYPEKITNCQYRCKKVILVDHNDMDQAVDNLNIENVVEVVDHHMIDGFIHSKAIFFLNEPVGATGGIVANLYEQNKVPISREMAGLMQNGNDDHKIMQRHLMETHMTAEKIFDNGKVRINYLETGLLSGAPLVMFHGGAWCWQEYLSLIPGPSRNWHVCALDLRGNGKSGWVTGQYRLEDFTEDGVSFLGSLIAPAVLVGHSIGGVVALMVAARYPDKAKAIIIEDSPLTIDNYRNIIESSREMFNTWLKLKKSAGSAEELSWALASEYRDYPGVTSQWIMFFAGCLWRLDPTFFDSLLYDFAGFVKGYDYKEIIKQIHCPILFLRGETKLGAVMTDAEITWLKNNFSNVTCVEIAGVGHLLHLQDQGQVPVQKEIMAFLKHISR